MHTAGVRASKCNTEGISVEECLAAGSVSLCLPIFLWHITFVHQPHSTPQSHYVSWCHCASASLCRYTLVEVREEGYLAQACISSGKSGQECYEAGYTWDEMNELGEAAGIDLGTGDTSSQMSTMTTVSTLTLTRVDTMAQNHTKRRC